MDDKKRGLVAQVSGGADDAAIGGVLGPSSISGNAHNPRHALRSRADVSARDLSSLSKTFTAVSRQDRRTYYKAIQ